MRVCRRDPERARCDGAGSGAHRLAVGDVNTVSGHSRVVVLRAHQKMASHYTAHVHADMSAVAEVMHAPEGDPLWQSDATSAEIRAALVLTRRAADAELGFAVDLKERLVGVAEALLAGEIDIRRAKTIGYGTTHVSAETAQKVVDQVIDDAPGLTSGQLRARIGRLCIDVGPEEAERRYELAVSERRVVAETDRCGDREPVGVGSGAGSGRCGDSADQPAGSGFAKLWRVANDGSVACRRHAGSPRWG